MRGRPVDLARALWLRQDVLLAGALLALGQALIWSGLLDEGDRVVVSVSYLVSTGSLALRRRRPLVMAVVLGAAWVLQAAVAGTPESILALFVLLIASYSAGAYASERASRAGLVVLMASVYLGLWLSSDAGLGDRIFTSPILAGGPWLAGRLVRRFREQAHDLAILNAELERRRAEDAEVAALAERTRIARELHDVVAHHLSLMVVQAGAAGRLLPADPVRASVEIEDVRRTGRSALVEMRRLLDVLRSDGAADAADGRPGMDQLDELVAGVTAAGLPTTLVRRGSDVRLEPGRDLAAYRIVQEALTNTLKHAGAQRCEVEVEGGDETLVISVRDDGRGATRPEIAHDGGHGLLGMQERAAYLGACLETGAGAEGGWRVVLRVPVTGVQP